MEINMAILLAISCLLLGIVSGLILGFVFKATSRRKHLKLGKKEGLVEVVRFWTDGDGKRIVPEVDGKFIHSMDDLDNQQQTRLGHLLEQLRMGSSPPARPLEKPISLRHLKESISSSQEEIISSQVEELVQQPLPGKNKMNLVDSLVKTLQPEPVSKFGAQSIVAQVDLILQENLLGTELGKKGIRLVESPEKGMLVYVGVQQYASVEDVPDAEVQVAIRAAVAHWERRYASFPG
jgi:hypothetical protein